ncbi:hypothetical protein [Bacteroides sedimenti]|uniref:Lipoprotein n=1 Tax=Bacteroides sedimenti TaxID=2136147 RepID=A0ABN6ZFV2_9BACE
MKKVYFLIIIAAINFGCRRASTELSFFKNMNQYAKFDSVKDRSILLGVDSIMLKPIYYKNNIQYCELLTPNKGVFDIKGIIWLKDSIVYIKTLKGKYLDTIKTQELFDFKAKNKTSEVCYLNPYPCYLLINMQGRYYNPQLKDSITIFRIEQDLRMGYADPYYITASLKHGFVEFVHWTSNRTYYIDFLPSQKAYVKVTKKKYLYLLK